jgi:hypothetical protein
MQEKQCRSCENCGHCFIDLSVNDYECECSEATEQEIAEHFTNGRTGCPHWIIRTTVD